MVLELNTHNKLNFVVQSRPEINDVYVARAFIEQGAQVPHEYIFRNEKTMMLEALLKNHLFSVDSQWDANTGKSYSEMGCIEDSLERGIQVLVQKDTRTVAEETELERRRIELSHEKHINTLIQSKMMERCAYMTICPSMDELFSGGHDDKARKLGYERGVYKIRVDYFDPATQMRKTTEFIARNKTTQDIEKMLQSHGMLPDNFVANSSLDLLQTPVQIPKDQYPDWDAVFRELEHDMYGEALDIRYAEQITEQSIPEIQTIVDRILQCAEEQELSDEEIEKALRILRVDTYISIARRNRMGIFQNMLQPHLGIPVPMQFSVCGALLQGNIYDWPSQLANEYIFHGEISGYVVARCACGTEVRFRGNSRSLSHSCGAKLNDFCDVQAVAAKKLRDAQPWDNNLEDVSGE